MEKLANQKKLQRGLLYLLGAFIVLSFFGYLFVITDPLNFIISTLTHRPKPNQVLFNDLYDEQHKSVFCNQKKKEMTAIAKKHILEGITVQQAADILEKNGFNISSDGVSGTRSGGELISGKIYYIVIETNNGKVKNVLAFIYCGAL